MIVSYPFVKNIFDTLPIGYYLGRDIDIALSKSSDSSYFNPAADSIIISYPMIADAVADVDEKDLNIEQVIRGLVYHEVSHVIMTPNELKSDVSKELSAAINILEDERIETVLKDFYMNTDFKKNVILINKYNPDIEAKNLREAFYNLVRFHAGEESWVRRLKQLIYMFRKIFADNNHSELRSEYIRFYRDFKDWYKKDHPDDDSMDMPESTFALPSVKVVMSSDDTDSSSGSGSTMPTDTSDEDSETNDTASEGTSSKDSSEDSDSSESSSSTANEDDDSEDMDEDDGYGESDDDYDLSDELKDLVSKAINAIADFSEINEDVPISKIKSSIKNAINSYYDAKLEARLNEIIYKKLKKNASTGSAINSYSGRLNPRSVGMRDDYKWWTQRNRMGHIRQFSKVHFNLFIDNSGSFWRNDNCMNTFIKTLDKLNIKDFTFDIITINTRICEWDDHNVIFESSGGNRLTKAIQKVVIKHQKPATNNVNIVLFDGDAHSDDHFRRTMDGETEPFKYFDLNNTIIISDYENERYINRAKLTKAKVKYTDNYTKEFINEVCNMIDKIL